MSLKSENIRLPQIVGTSKPTMATAGKLSARNTQEPKPNAHTENTEIMCSLMEKGW